MTTEDTPQEDPRLVTYNGPLAGVVTAGCTLPRGEATEVSEEAAEKLAKLTEIGLDISGLEDLVLAEASLDDEVPTSSNEEEE